MRPLRTPDFMSLAQGCKRLRKLSRFHVILTYESSSSTARTCCYPGLLFAPLPPFSRQKLFNEEEAPPEHYCGPRPLCRTIVHAPVPASGYVPNNPLLCHHFDATLGFEGEGPSHAHCKQNPLREGMMPMQKWSPIFWQVIDVVASLPVSVLRGPATYTFCVMLSASSFVQSARILSQPIKAMTLILSAQYVTYACDLQAPTRMRTNADCRYLAPLAPAFGFASVVLGCNPIQLSLIHISEPTRPY